MVVLARHVTMFQGAAVIRMMKYFLGERTFQRGLSVSAPPN